MDCLIILIWWEPVGLAVFSDYSWPAFSPSTDSIIIPAAPLSKQGTIYAVFWLMFSYNLKAVVSFRLKG